MGPNDERRISPLEDPQNREDQDGKEKRKWQRCSWRRVLLTVVMTYSFVGFFHLFPHVIRSSLGKTTLQKQKQGYKTLSFQTCNGFVNQRISLVLGVVLAKELGRGILMPEFVLDAKLNATMPLWNFYDIRLIREVMIQHEVSVFRGTDDTPPISCSQYGRPCLEELADKTKRKSHIAFGCVWEERVVTAEHVLKHKDLVTDLLAGLQPSAWLENVINKRHDDLRASTKLEVFNLLHVQAEGDWIKRCQRESVRDGIVRDNCVNNTFALGKQLKAKGFPPSVVVYDTTDWSLVKPSSQRKILASLTAEGYAYMMHTNFAVSKDAVGREVQALALYYLGMRAYMTIGNSADTFSALMILERRLKGSFASQYNGGDIPLVRSLPIHRFPWVFHYSDSERQSTYLMQAAVRSAVHVGDVVPFCLYEGDRVSAMADWMLARNVTVILLLDVWKKLLIDEQWKSLMQQLYKRKSTNPFREISRFLQLEIPLVPELAQYEFVLYSDVNVFFRKRVWEAQFPSPLPRTVGMGPEVTDKFPFNARVALWNNNNMLHFPLAKFWTTDEEEIIDIDFSRRFYVDSIQEWVMPDIFDAKPYLKYDPEAVLVRWQGPRPHDYLDYLLKDECRFGDLCRTGLDQGACEYVMEWSEHSDSSIGSKLRRTCEAVL